jgi:hypothetical protein
MFNFAQTKPRKENTVRRVVESAMIYTLTVILVLVGAAASATIVIAMRGAGAPVLRRWRRGVSCLAGSAIPHREAHHGDSPCYEVHCKGDTPKELN